MTAAVFSGRSCSSGTSLPLQLPALIPRGPWRSSSTTCIKSKHSSSQHHHHHHHLTPPALTRTSTWTPKKKPILTVTNINCNTTSGTGASQSRPSSSSSPSSSISEEVVYQGVYGPWTIQPSDVTEVVLYRTGLVTAAASFVLASTTIFLPYDTPLGGFFRTNLDVFYALGACGLGLSLYLIHIYVTEIKRTLQALWVLGALGSLVTYASFAQPAGKHLVHYVIQYPAATWFVGPLFAALTGLVFKEGMVLPVLLKILFLTCLQG